MFVEIPINIRISFISVPFHRNSNFSYNLIDLCKDTAKSLLLQLSDSAQRRGGRALPHVSGELMTPPLNCRHRVILATAWGRTAVKTVKIFIKFKISQIGCSSQARTGLPQGDLLRHSARTSARKLYSPSKRGETTS